MGKEIQVYASGLQAELKCSRHEARMQGHGRARKVSVLRCVGTRGTMAET